MFKDVDGLFYEVHGASLLNPELDPSIWQRRSAIKVVTNNRVPQSIFVANTAPATDSPAPKETIPEPEQLAPLNEQEKISTALRTLLQNKRHLSEEQVEQLIGLVYLARNHVRNKPK